MTSPKTNTTILYIVLLIVGTLQLIMVTKQIFAEWSIDHNLRRFLLVLRFCLNAGFITIFSIKLKKITALNSDSKEATQL